MTELHADEELFLAEVEIHVHRLHDNTLVVALGVRDYDTGKTHLLRVEGYSFSFESSCNHVLVLTDYLVVATTFEDVERGSLTNTNLHSIHVTLEFGLGGRLLLLSIAVIVIIVARRHTEGKGHCHHDGINIFCFHCCNNKFVLYITSL